MGNIVNYYYLPIYNHYNGWGRSQVLLALEQLSDQVTAVDPSTELQDVLIRLESLNGLIRGFPATGWLKIMVIFHGDFWFYGGFMVISWWFNGTSWWFSWDLMIEHGIWWLSMGFYGDSSWMLIFHGIWCWFNGIENGLFNGFNGNISRYHCS